MESEPRHIGLHFLLEIENESDRPAWIEEICIVADAHNFQNTPAPDISFPPDPIIHRPRKRLGKREVMVASRTSAEIRPIGYDHSFDIVSSKVETLFVWDNEGIHQARSNPPPIGGWVVYRDSIGVVRKATFCLKAKALGSDVYFAPFGGPDRNNEKEISEF